MAHKLFNLSLSYFPDLMPVSKIPIMEDMNLGVISIGDNGDLI